MVKKTEEEKAAKKSLIDRIKKASTIDSSAILTESKYFGKKDYVTTPIPAINIALTGEPDGGLSAGSFVLAAPSRHFKSLFALLFASSYFTKYPDAALLFYDSEFGTPLSYFDSFDIDKNRVLHSPLMNIEQLTFDLVKQLDALENGDHLIIIVDSLGGLASKKELEDALEGNSAEDMTRARKIKSMFRTITSYLTIKNVTFISINHVYQTMERISKTIISGGNGVMLAADNAWIIGRQQEKDKIKSINPETGKTQTIEELVGYNFVINIEKSRHVKEKSKIIITTTHDGGIEKWSGMREIAEAGGFVFSPKQGYLQHVNPETGEITGNIVRVKTNKTNDEFWNDLVYHNDAFKKYVKESFALGQIKMIGDGLDDDDDDGIEEDLS